MLGEGALALWGRAFFVVRVARVFVRIFIVTSVGADSLELLESLELSELSL